VQEAAHLVCRLVLKFGLQEGEVNTFYKVRSWGVVFSAHAAKSGARIGVYTSAVSPE
jgi:hypothetical protein